MVRASAARQAPANLKAVAPGTLSCKVTEVGFVPIPGPFAKAIAGLVSIQSPPGVPNGKEYRVVLRQVSGLSHKVLGTTEFRIKVSQAAELLPIRSKTSPSSSTSRSPFRRAIVGIRSSNNTWQNSAIGFAPSVAIRTRWSLRLTATARSRVRPANGLAWSPLPAKCTACSSVASANSKGSKCAIAIAGKGSSRTIPGSSGSSSSPAVTSCASRYSTIPKRTGRNSSPCSANFCRHRARSRR